MTRSSFASSVFVILLVSMSLLSSASAEPESWHPRARAFGPSSDRVSGGDGGGEGGGSDSGDDGTSEATSSSSTTSSSSSSSTTAYYEPIHPRTSRCYDIPGFTAVDGSPTRSPMNMADYLIDATKGKTLTEIGSRNGDIIACLTHHKKAERGTSVSLREVPCCLFLPSFLRDRLKA